MICQPSFQGATKHPFILQWVYPLQNSNLCQSEACGLWVWSRKLRIFYTGRRGRNGEAEEFRAAFDDMHRFAQALGHENQHLEDPQVLAIGMAIGVALDAVMAVIKVGLLLFMKSRLYWVLHSTPQQWVCLLVRSKTESCTPERTFSRVYYCIGLPGSPLCCCSLLPFCNWVK